MTAGYLIRRTAVDFGIGLLTNIKYATHTLSLYICSTLYMYTLYTTLCIPYNRIAYFTICPVLYSIYLHIYVYFLRVYMYRCATLFVEALFRDKVLPCKSVEEYIAAPTIG